MTVKIHFPVLFLLLSFANLQAQNQRGDLVSDTLIGFFSFQDLQNIWVQNGIPTAILQYENEVEVYKLVYRTLDVFGQNLITASGALVVPVDPDCPMPLVSYSHGTSIDRIMSELDEEITISVVIASMGYMAAAADYLGYGESNLSPHGYNMKEPLATDGVDMLRAARHFSAAHNLDLNGQIFLTGVSEGGYAAMSIHRKLEEEHAAEFDVAGGAPGSGAYIVSPVSRDSMMSDYAHNIANSVNVSSILFTYQTLYNLYPDWSDIFVSPYDTIIPRLWNLANPDPAMVNLLADTTMQMLLPSVVSDMRTNPNHPFQLLLEENNVHDWVPQSPLFMLYCENDEQVPYQNAILTRDTMLMNGATNVTAFSASNVGDHFACHPPSMIFAKLFFDNYVEWCNTTALDETEVWNAIDVFPNPFSETLHIHLPETIDSQIDITLFDLSGRILRQTVESGSREITLDRDGLPAGLYVIEIGNETLSFRQMVMVE